MKTKLLVFSVCALLGIALGAMAVPALAQAPTPATALNVVQTDAGLVGAALDSTADVGIFKMIPYAAPPVGDLRWKSPQPVTPWQGVRKAPFFSPMCMQTVRLPTALFYFGSQGISEDCLYLNVWTPAITSTAKLPVMFVIPPGANAENGTSNQQLDGMAFAKKGVVFVSINFRLGVFGFLAHPELTAESGANNASGNYGILDQIAALKWVQKNIAAFGGDPSNVTVIGGPTFSQNVTSLTASPLAKGVVPPDYRWQRHGLEFCACVRKRD